MNFLLINHYAGSSIHGMEYRPFYLAREWVRSGHKVSIVAASFSHLHSTAPTINGLSREEEIEGIRYIWLKTPQYEGNGAGRVLNMITFSIMLLIQKSIILREKVDVIIASSPHPFIIYGARFLARISKAKLVFEVRDLWPLTLIELGSISQSHPFVKFMKSAEEYAYRTADYVVSLLPKTKDYMIEKGMRDDIFSYIPNGVDLTEWSQRTAQLPDQHNTLLLNLKDKGHYIVGYAGGHGISNALVHLIEAAVHLKSENVSFVLVGKGQEKRKLEKMTLEMGLKNVFFLPPVPKHMVPSLLSLMDILFIGWKKSTLYRFGISPNKLLDYMMSGKPVVHSIEAGNDIVAESGCGISVPPEDSGAIANAIMSIVSMSLPEREKLGQRGNKFVLENHNYAVLAKKFLAVLDE